MNNLDIQRDSDNDQGLGGQANMYGSNQIMDKLDRLISYSNSGVQGVNDTTNEHLDNNQALEKKSLR